MTDFNTVAKAIILLTNLDSMKDFDELAKEYGEYSNQEFPQELLRKFKLTGLSNVDFLTSDFLHQNGYLELIGFEIKQNQNQKLNK